MSGEPHAASVVDRFAALLEAGDREGLHALMDADTRFSCPTHVEPHAGRDVAHFILCQWLSVLEDIAITPAGPHDGRSPALYHFTATAEGRPCEGVFRLEGRESHDRESHDRESRGQITGITLMLRPLVALEAASHAVHLRLERHSGGA